MPTSRLSKVTRASRLLAPHRLAAVVRGHQAYYAVPGNSDAVNAFRTQVVRHWRKALRRRSTVHPFPQARFTAMHPR
jgi:hypothetical protein